MTTPYYSDDAVTIWHGNALALPIPDESVDLIVTSPPYFGLRSYTDGGEHYDGQIGSEPTPREFVDALLAATAEMVRVLKPSGSIWVNLGDKYQATSFAPQKRGKDASGVERPTETKACERCGEEFTGGLGRRFCSSYCGGSDNSPRAQRGGIPVKSLMGLPWRYAIRCIDELGLILRAEVIWSKPNGLPESVTDRVRRSHETWFHFTREPRYFSAVDEIREEYLSADDPRWQRQTRGTNPHRNDGGMAMWREGKEPNPLGKLPGSVWEVPTQPLKVPAHLGIDHFAAFPMEWPRRIIRGWSPTGVCVECGEGRRPVAAQVDEAYAAERARVRANRAKRTTREEGLAETFGGPGGRTNTGGFSDISNGVVRPSYAVTGYVCACKTPTAPTRPAVVLDPFGGTGTTALVAKALGRTGWHVDLSADYCRLAQWRVTDPSEMARAMQVEKPPAAPEDMDSLLDLIGDLGGVA